MELTVYWVTGELLPEDYVESSRSEYVYMTVVGGASC